MQSQSLLQKLDGAIYRIKMVEKERNEILDRIQVLQHEANELRQLIAVAEAKAEEILKSN